MDGSGAEWFGQGWASRDWERQGEVQLRATKVSVSAQASIEHLGLRWNIMSRNIMDSLTLSLCAVGLHMTKGGSAARYEPGPVQCRDVGSWMPGGHSAAT